MTMHQISGQWYLFLSLPENKLGGVSNDRQTGDYAESDEYITYRLTAEQAAALAEYVHDPGPPHFGNVKNDYIVTLSGDYSAETSARESEQPGMIIAVAGKDHRDEIARRSNKYIGDMENLEHAKANLHASCTVLESMILAYPESTHLTMWQTELQKLGGRLKNIVFSDQSALGRPRPAYEHALNYLKLLEILTEKMHDAGMFSEDMLDENTASLASVAFSTFTNAHQSNNILAKNLGADKELERLLSEYDFSAIEGTIIERGTTFQESELPKLANRVVISIITAPIPVRVLRDDGAVVAEQEFLKGETPYNLFPTSTLTVHVPVPVYALTSDAELMNFELVGHAGKGLVKGATEELADASTASRSVTITGADAPDAAAAFSIIIKIKDLPAEEDSETEQDEVASDE